MRVQKYGKRTEDKRKRAKKSTPWHEIAPFPTAKNLQNVISIAKSMLYELPNLAWNYLTHLLTIWKYHGIPSDVLLVFYLFLQPFAEFSVNLPRINVIITATHMRLLRKLILATAMILVVNTAASAARVTAIVNAYTLKYQSVDAFNNPITLSEKIYVNQVYSNIKFIMVHNHPTTTNDAITPTGSSPQVEEVKYMCDGTELAMVVAPDYLGYGESVGTTHPYMCATLTARNIVDGITAAIDYITTQSSKRNGNYHFEDDYYTLNEGYSQGGATALAVHKYLETEASQAVKDKVKLKRTLCGAGPHQQSEIFDTMEQQDDMCYSLYIPFAIDGLKYTFGNSIMRALSEEEIYTEKFLQSGLLAKMREKNTTAADLNSTIANYFGGKVGFYDIIRPEYKDRSSKLYRTLQKALKQSNLLEGWTPTKPIVFYHWENDEVVPYSQSVNAYNHFKALGCDVELKEATTLNVTGEWRLKSYEKTHMGYGTKFYLLLFCESLR